MKRQISVYLSVFIALIFLSCGKKEPLKIGYAGTLSGKFSEFGINGRDGVILAVEEMNRKGGINGREIELLLNDDKNDPEKALSGDIEMIKKGVVAIIGHMTSNMSLASVREMNKRKIPMVSPTTSTTLLDNMDDYFFRVVSSTEVEIKAMSRYILKNYNLKSISFILDRSNSKYTGNMLKHFKKSLGKNNVSIRKVVEYNSKSDKSYYKITRKAISSGLDAIVVLANSRDSALFCQQIRKISKSIPIILCAWAQEGDFIVFGGNAVEGVLFTHHFFPSQEDVKYNDFRKRYIKRFNKEPEFASAYSFDAANIVLRSLIKNSNPRELKQTILKTGRFNGVGGPFVINRNGDTMRHYKMITVKKGKFVEIK